MTVVSPTALPPFVPWPELDTRLDWRQGEHITLVGPTGCGKTTLALGLLERRHWVVAIGTKPRDTTLSGLLKQGYRRVQAWPPPSHYRRVVLWPRKRKIADRFTQERVIREALHSIYQSWSWCIFADELEYLSSPAYLGLEFELREIWQQGRAVNISLVGATQRPRHVPLAAYSQATHLFLWRSSDEGDLKRLSELNGADTRTVRATLPRLTRFECLYVNTRDGELWRTRYQP